MIIRELDANKKFIKSSNLITGSIFTPATNTKYLAIGIYRSTGETGITYNTYKDLFAKGFVAKLTKQTTSANQDTNTSISQSTPTQSNTTTSTVTNVENKDFTKFTNWRTGQYDMQAGVYQSYVTRLCLNDYVTFSGSKYKVSVSDTNYNMLIRELDTNKKFIKSSNLVSGSTFTPATNTKYLAIGIYRSAGETGITYNTYKDLFAKGFVAKLAPSNGEEKEEELKVEDVGSAVPAPVDNKSLFKQELIEILRTADTSKHDVSKYNISSVEEIKGWVDEVRNEGIGAISASINCGIACSYAFSNGRVQFFSVAGFDDDYLNRLDRLEKLVNNMVFEAKGMNDVEKVVFVHDYVVSHTYYSKTGTTVSIAAGPLLDGKGLCTGYAEATILLLRAMGVEAEKVSSRAMQHAWVKVKVNGKWYHTDPTWDDTRSSKSGQVSHNFLLRTDSEFMNVSTNKHYGWTGTVSTDTTFVNWFVHDIVGEIKHTSAGWSYTDSATGKKVVIDL